MRKLLLAVLFILSGVNFCLQKAADAADAADATPVYYAHPQDARYIVSLVTDAASDIGQRGESAFADFKKEGSKWRHEDTYIFILDPEGNMVLHPDPALEGKNQLQLKDVNNKPIIKWFIAAALTDKKEGWVHYQWPEPRRLFPLWKSTFVKLVISPSGKEYIVCCGLYNMKIEKEFISALVDSAAELVEKEGEDAFVKLRDKSGPFMFMDIYVFVDQPDGVELVNAAFPSLEGRNLMDYR